MLEIESTPTDQLDLLSSIFHVDALNVFPNFDNNINLTVSDDVALYRASVEVVDGVCADGGDAQLIESVKNISVYYQNINRSKTKTTQLFLSVIENDYDIIVLVETNFDSSIIDEEVFDNRYLVYRCDRVLNVNSVKSSGGGVVVAVKKSFNSVACPDMSNSCEEMWIKVSFVNLKLFFCGVYLPHSAPDEFCNRHINSVEKISDVADVNDLILICGDFNLSNITWTNRDDELCPNNVNTEREFCIIDGMAECDLAQVNTIPNQYITVKNNWENFS